ncbi:hypothetical protein PVNG_02379 [Plasmodium vivax North Korean]|uniref:DNA polymerase III beta sliding clamp C-terminal domain-containing protein n=1 Tax=Plasmodium vivax North Korean TaxID=1035514 RepID=A0A0J9TM47_PLAVI|nr:hypothetical protein PVNG_02379 [Plasmodium vivax North Korean]
MNLIKQKREEEKKINIFIATDNLKNSYLYNTFFNNIIIFNSPKNEFILELIDNILEKKYSDLKITTSSKNFLSCLLGNNLKEVLNKLFKFLIFLEGFNYQENILDSKFLKDNFDNLFHLKEKRKIINYEENEQLKIICEKKKFDLEKIKSKSKKKMLVFQRDQIIYILNTRLGFSYSDISKILSRNIFNIYYSVKKIKRKMNKEVFKRYFEKNEIFMKCKNKELIIYSNNGTIECQIIFSKDEIKCKRQGEAIINSKVLMVILENLKNYSEIEFDKIENSFLKISSNKFECNIICFSKKINLENNFDNLNYEKLTFNFNDLLFVNNKFKDFYKNLGNNIQKNSVFNSINFKKNNSSFEVSSILTNSYTILFSNFKCHNSMLEKEFEFNLPAEVLGSIVILFKENHNSKEIDIFYKKENIMILSNNLFLKAKLYEGNFPFLHNLLIFNETFNFSVGKNILISAIDRNLLLSEQNLNITFYKVIENSLFLEYKNSYKGFINEEVEIEKKKGDVIKFSLNSLFLKQLLKNISDDKVIFSFSDPFKPILLFGEKEHEKFKQIILPLKYS